MAVNLKRLVYFDSFMDPIANAIIGRRDDIDLVRLEYDTPEADNWAELSQAHGYQIQPRGELREPWFGDAALLARCPNMLALSSTGAGYDMIDVDACTAAGVIVVNQSGTNWEPVAEHALGMMLSLTKKIALSERAMKRTPNLDRRPYAGNNLRNNTARGGIHDEVALAAALRDGRIAGAGLDVFLKEPPDPDHPLLNMDNVIASPHIAGMTVETMTEMCEATALQWLTIFDGGVPPRLVNPEVWPHYSARFAELLGFRPGDLPEARRD